MRQLGLFDRPATAPLPATAEDLRPAARLVLANSAMRASGLYLLAAADDPPRRRQPNDPSMDSHAWLALVENGHFGCWLDRIRERLEDGVPRTFPRLCVEISGFEAKVCAGRVIDHALWALVERGEVVHTDAAPVLFSMLTAVVPERVEPDFSADFAATPWRHWLRWVHQAADASESWYLADCSRAQRGHSVSVSVRVFHGLPTTEASVSDLRPTLEETLAVIRASLGVAS